MDKIRNCCDEKECLLCYIPHEFNCCTKCYTEIDHEFTEEVVCPYCGYEFSDSWEFSDNAEIECDECGETFISERNSEVTYSTQKKED